MLWFKNSEDKKSSLLRPDYPLRAHPAVHFRRVLTLRVMPVGNHLSYLPLKPWTVAVRAIDRLVVLGRHRQVVQFSMLHQ
jgi:hypothetical protein